MDAMSLLDIEPEPNEKTIIWNTSTESAPDTEHYWQDMCRNSEIYEQPERSYHLANSQSDTTHRVVYIPPWSQAWRTWTHLQQWCDCFRILRKAQDSSQEDDLILFLIYQRRRIKIEFIINEKVMTMQCQILLYNALQKNTKPSLG